MGVLWLSREDVRRAGGGDPFAAMPLVEAALVAHGAGDSCQPLKPYLLIPGDTRARRIIAMPAYLGADFQTWGLKWIASAPDNPSRRGMERASALIVLNDLETGAPVALMEGALISATRTAAVALLASRHLCRADARTLAVLGAGAIGSLIAQSLLAAHPTLERVRVYDAVEASAGKLAAALESAGGRGDIACEVAPGPRQAIEGADVVLTATTAQEGYVEGDWLAPGSLFLNVSLRDPEASVFERADKLVVDDWEQANRGTTALRKATRAGLLGRDDLHAELHEILEGAAPGRESDDEIVLFNPMGLSIEDVATAWGVYREARRQGLGVELDLYG